MIYGGKKKFLPLTDEQLQKIRKKMESAASRGGVASSEIQMRDRMGRFAGKHGEFDDDKKDEKKSSKE